MHNLQILYANSGAVEVSIAPGGITADNGYVYTSWMGDVTNDFEADFGDVEVRIQSGGASRTWKQEAGKAFRCGLLKIYPHGGDDTKTTLDVSACDFECTLPDGDAQLTLGDPNANSRSGGLILAAGNAYTIDGIAGASGADTLALGAAKVKLGGTFDGTGIAVTSEGAEFFGAGELKNITDLDGDIYAPVAMDGGGNDVTTPDNRVIFMAAGGLLGRGRVGAILGRRW